MLDAVFVMEIAVPDPNTGEAVAVEIWKDPASGGLFGVDASFLDQVRDNGIPSPFNAETRLRLPAEAVEVEPDAAR
jgi:hypothetical protein